MGGIKSKDNQQAEGGEKMNRFIKKELKELSIEELKQRNEILVRKNIKLTEDVAELEDAERKFWIAILIASIVILVLFGLTFFELGKIINYQEQIVSLSTQLQKAMQ